MLTGRGRRPLFTFLLGLAALGAVGVGMPATAGAIGTADQQQPLHTGSITLPPGLAQTFTVGRTGRLDGVELRSPSGGRFVLQVYELRADGTPDINRPLLSSAPQANLLAGTLTQVALPEAPVVEGQQLALAIGLLNPAYTTATLTTASGDPYAAGQLFQVPGIYTFNPVAGVDLEFVTHVTSAPAPTAIALSSLSATGGRPTAALTSGGRPVVGRTITFEIRRADGRPKASCTAVTDAAGVAVCAKVKWQLPAGGALVATFTGDAEYAPTTQAVTG